MSPRIPAASICLLLALVACQAGSGTDAGRPKVVATTTVLADLVRQVGGDRVEVRSLVPAGGEVHTFEPRPSDITALAAADLIFLNGLGLDDWLHGLADEAGSGGPVIALGEDLEGVEYIAGEEDHDDGAEEPAEGVNPHLWLDAAYAGLYVERIAQALASVDPEGAQVYHTAGRHYRQALADLDAEIREQMAAIPDSRRSVVSVHAAFDYFARAYDLEVVGVVIEAPGQDPSAGEIAALVDEIRELGVSAILAEIQFPATLAQRIADETGVIVIDGLHTDALSGAVDSYLTLMRENTRLIVAALGS